MMGMQLSDEQQAGLEDRFILRDPDQLLEIRGSNLPSLANCCNRLWRADWILPVG